MSKEERRRHFLQDDEIESALEDNMFGLPSDPDNSEDDAESDEERVFYNHTKLQRILEDLDEPGLRSTDTIRASHSTSSDNPDLSSIDTVTATLSPQPSTSRDEPGLRSMETASLSLQPSTSNADLPSSTYLGRDQTILPARGRDNRRGMGRESGRGTGWESGRGGSLNDGDSDATICNESSESQEESETNASEEDEGAWKKVHGLNAGHNLTSLIVSR